MTNIRNMKKVQRILKNEEMAVIITKDAAWLNGDAFEVVAGIQQVIKGILEDGFPKEIAKKLIDVAFMTEEELENEAKKSMKELAKNLDMLCNKKGKKEKESKDEHK